MLEIYAFFFFFFTFLYIHLAKHQSALGTTLFFLPLLSLEVKLEKKRRRRRRTSKSCVSKFVIYSELSRIKRLAWVKVFIKSNNSNNEKRAIH